MNTIRKINTKINKKVKLDVDFQLKQDIVKQKDSIEGQNKEYRELC